VGDRVSRMVSHYIGEIEGKVEKRASKPVTFSMRLSAREHAKLVWLAKNLDVPKTPFAEELLKAALDEAIERYAGWASPEKTRRALSPRPSKTSRIECGTQGPVARPVASAGRVPGATPRSLSATR
jgi:hypothetical protein